MAAHEERAEVAGLLPQRHELVDWKKRKSPIWRQIAFYAALALIPVVVFSLLIYVMMRHK